MSPHARLRLRLLATCLALGALINVAVAWACAVRLNPDVVTATPPSSLLDDDFFERAARDRLRQQLPYQASDDEIVVCDEHAVGAMRRAVFVFPYWKANPAIFRSLVGPLSTVSPLVLRVRAGWPCQSLEATQTMAEPSTRLAAARFDRRWMLGVRVGGDVEKRVLPLKPLWPGFAVNTLLYAILAWLLLFAPLALRRSMRRRRNLCERCGYPRGSSDHCSECGARL